MSSDYTFSDFSLSAYLGMPLWILFYSAPHVFDEKSLIEFRIFAYFLRNFMMRQSTT